MIDQPPAPIEFDPLIGRSADLDRVEAELVAHRLLTITGPGGTGKTRIAKAILQRWTSPSADAWFVDLAPVYDARSVLSSIAAALNLDDRAATDPATAVPKALSGRPTVIVLDNLEQIPHVGQVVLELLRECSALRVLGTSRMPMGVAGELTYALRPLQLPAAETAEAVSASPAGALFLARARSIGRVQTLDDDAAADIAELLRRLDGLPLAIELAAARTRALTPQEILRRLDSRGSSAIGGHPESEPHSLLAVLDWTLGMLDDDASEILSAASICAGFDLELMEAMVTQPDALVGLESLIRLGLVSVESSSKIASRFGLLEVIREEANRRLAPEQREQLEDRLATEMVQRAALWFRAPSREWRVFTSRADADTGNFLTALERLERTNPRAALGLWYQLELFWLGRGRHEQGAARFERLRHLDPKPSVELARASAVYLGLVDRIHGPGQIEKEAAVAVELARRVRDPYALVVSLERQLLAKDAIGDLVGVQDTLSQLEHIEPDASEPGERLRLLHAIALAVSAVRGWESDEAVAAFEAVRDAIDGAVDDRNAATSINLNLAQTYIYRGDFAQAAQSARRAIESSREVGDDRMVGYGFTVLAGALAGLRRVIDAIDSLRDAVDSALTYAEPEWLNEYFCKAMPVAVLARQPLLAARLWGASRTLVMSGQATLAPADLESVERLVEEIRHKVGTLEVERAITDGMASEPSSLALALPDLLEAATRSARRGPDAHHGRHAELTKREVEVLRLVGMGMSDPDIAAALFISPKTASVHVANIKAKLGLHSRLEVGLRARELGLITSPSPNETASTRTSRQAGDT